MQLGIIFISLFVVSSLRPTHCGSSASDPSLPPCGDPSWIPHKNEKCLKLIDHSVTHAEADQLCRDDSHGIDVSSLVTIKTKEEQDDVAHWILETYHVVGDFWVGSASSNFRKNILSNNADDDDTKMCIILQLSGSTLLQATQQSIIDSDDGSQMTTEDCSARHMVVCQKPQTLTLPQLHRAMIGLIDELTKKSEVQELQLKLINMELKAKSEELDSRIAAQDEFIISTSREITDLHTTVKSLLEDPVPINFVYVQLPDEAEPQVLWPTVTWTQITSSYAGLFFRAEGGNSLAFGVEQNDNTRRINQMTYDMMPSPPALTINLPNSGWSDWGQVGLYANATIDKHHEVVAFKVDGGEVRPRNKAIRIWKRTA